MVNCVTWDLIFNFLLLGALCRINKPSYKVGHLFFLTRLHFPCTVITFTHKAMKPIPLDLWNSRLPRTSISRLEILVTGGQLGHIYIEISIINTQSILRLIVILYDIVIFDVKTCNFVRSTPTTNQQMIYFSSHYHHDDLAFWFPNIN